MVMLDTAKIGQFILTKRKEAGYTQQQLAERLGVTNKAVSKWETAEGLPDISLFPALSEVLGVSVDELLRGEAAGEVGSGQGARKPQADSPALHRYQLERQVEKFKKSALLALLVSIAGIVCFSIIWLENQDYYSFGVGIIAQLISGYLFLRGYWSLQFEAKAYGALYPAEPVTYQPLFVKFLCLLMLFWIVVPLLFLDYLAIYMIPYVRSIYVILAGVALYGMVVCSLLRRRKS